MEESWLTKNARPLGLVFVLAALALFTTLDAFGHQVRDQWLTIWEDLVTVFVIAYVGARTLDKGLKTWAGQKDPK